MDQPADTIVGIATPPGMGAVAVLRVSGPRARQVVEPLVRGWPAPREAALRRVRSGGETLDQVLLLWFPGPASYTGEDVVELHTHGGRVAPRRVLDAVLAQGARLAEPGEFSRRAVLAGKLGLDQAEAVDDLIRAPSEELATRALAQMDGALRGRIEDLRARLIELAARIEAQLDFPDEDVPDVEVGEAVEGAAGVAQAVAALAETFERSRVLREGARVALCGQPNVGKSSLLNALLGADRAIVTDEAGTTRDLIEEVLEVDGVALRLTDTAGLREAPGEAERQGVARARAVVEAADVRVLVTEAGRELAPVEVEALAALDPTRDLLVRNKVDLAGDVEPALPEGWTGSAVCETSALDGAGVEALAAALRARALVGVPEAEDVVVTRARHHQALRGASEALARFRDATEAGLPADVALVELYASRDELGAVVGLVGVEDVLDEVFSRFCLGK